MFRALWALLLLAVLSAQAWAQTVVSGAIATDTTWTLAGSPYLVSGGVAIQNGAVLTIDAGVTAYMGSGASVSVQSGAIKAQGTASSPIRILSDNTRLGAPAAPGDWDRWIFGAGTVNTRLEHVLFENGKGLVVNGSAPIFNYLELRNHQGAAITIDLAASPSGVGNQASGNTLNGIAVPAGDIAGSVSWGLRGIPYVVSSGVVSVGLSPTIATITPNRLQQGDTATVRLAGSRLTNLAEARFDATGVSAQVLPGGTSTQVDLSVSVTTAAALGATGLSLLVDAGEVRFPGAITVERARPTITSLDPAVLLVGQGAAEVLVNGRNFSDQSSVLVGGNPVTTQFLVPSQLRASIANQAAAGTLSLRVRAPDPLNAGQFLVSDEASLPVVPGLLALKPASLSVSKGFSNTLTLTLPYAAPAEVTVNLSSNVPAVASVPATATVPQGQTSATFQVTGADLGGATITASGAAFMSAQAQVTVVPPPTLTLAPNPLVSAPGRSVQLTIQSSVPAGAAGLAVTLSSSDTAVVTAPASVTIPAGASSTTTTVSTVGLGDANILAQATDFVTGTAAVTVRAAFLTLPGGALVSPGLTRAVTLSLSDPAPAGGLVVSLASSNTAFATVPASVTVPAGASSFDFTLTGVAVGSATVSASAAGYQAASVTASVEAVAISVGAALTSISMPATISSSYGVSLSRPATAGGVVINLAIADTGKATVSPSTITIPEGQTSSGPVQVTVTGVAAGTTTLVASAAGLSSATVNITVTGKPELQLRTYLGTNSTAVGKGMRTYSAEVFVVLFTDAQQYSAPQPVTVNLSVSDGSKASVPASVIIPANTSSTTFPVTGIELTGAPVTVDASAAGYTAPTTKLSVRVVNPQLTLNELDASRSTLSPRDDFNVGLSVPGAIFGTQQTAVAAIPINLSIVEDAPAGLVPGFYSAPSGGSAVVQTAVAPDNTGTPMVYVGRPTASGSYKVRAEIAGGNSAVSALQTVSAPDLRIVTYLGTTSTVVGKGMRTYSAEVFLQRLLNGNLFNGVEAVTVTLSSSDGTRVSVPASVTIPANTGSTTFLVTGVDLTGSTPVTLDVSAPGYNASATKLSVQVVNPAPVIYDLQGSRSTASPRDDFSIGLSVPGAIFPTQQTAAAAIPINLSIVEDVPAGLIAGIYATPGGGSPITQTAVQPDNTGSPSVYVGQPTAAGSYKVRAEIPGGNSAVSALQTSVSPALKVRTYLGTSATAVGKGMRTYSAEVSVDRTINGVSFAGADDLTVSLACASGTICTVPPTVTIPANQGSAAFTVDGIGFGPSTIIATAPGYAAGPEFSVNVIAPQLVFTGPAGATVGASTAFTLNLTVPGAIFPSSQSALSPFVVDLSSSSPSVATVPATVTIPTGDNTVNSNLTGVSQGTTTLTASGAGLSSATTPTINVTAVCLPPPSGLIGWWTGDDTASDSAGTRNGTLQNGATFGAGKVGQGFSLDGSNDYVNLGPAAAPALTDFTLHAWVSTSPAVNTGERRIVGFDDIFLATPAGRQYYDLKSSSPFTCGADGRPALQISAGGSQICAPSALSAGFHHLAGVRSGGTLSLYVDGVLVAQGAASVGLISPTAPLVIGQVSPAYNGEYFNGLIDEVAVHNRALSANEISRIFGAGSMGMCR